MPVPLSTPIIRSAVAKATFDLGFYTDFALSGCSITTGNVRFTRAPMASNTGELLPSEASGFTIDFWDAVNNIPEAKAAVDALLIALPKVEAYIAAKKA